VFGLVRVNLLAHQEEIAPAIGPEQQWEYHVHAIIRYQPALKMRQVLENRGSRKPIRYRTAAPVRRELEIVVIRNVGARSGLYPLPSRCDCGSFEFRKAQPEP
jgi:hypothetical protein